MDVAREQLRRPLTLLVATGGPPGKIRLAITQRERRREGGTRPLAGRERGGMAFLQPEHLRARAETESEFRNDGRGLQPSAGRRRRAHVAGVIGDGGMPGITAHLAPTTPGRPPPAP